MYYFFKQFITVFYRYVNTFSFLLQLLERLKKEQDCNLRLKQYVDKILLTIIDKNPSLLEITNKWIPNKLVFHVMYPS